MAMQRINTPAFGGEKTYERWKEEIAAWELICGVDKKKQALLIALSFPEGSEVRDKVFNEVKNADLNKEDGLKVLLEHLDKWYKRDDLSAAYESWTKFDSYKKVKEEEMDKYIMEFDKRSKTLSKHKVTIPNCILAFKLLDSAGLDTQEKQIVMTAVTFDEPDKMYDAMKLALRKFFGSQEVLSLNQKTNVVSNSENSNTSAVVIKSEPVFSAEEVQIIDRGRGRGRFRGGRGFTRNRYNQRGGVQRNSMDWRGNTRKCYVCGSEFHLASSCPKNVYINNVDEETDECLMASVRGSTEMTALVVESFNCAVLDSACTSTVCGNDWLQSYMHALSEKEVLKVTEEDSNTTFRFGDGEVHASMKKVKIPVTIVGKKINIVTDVVDCGIPLLLSKKSMKKAKIEIKFEDDTAVIFGRRLKLTCTSSGHYCIPLTDENESRQNTEEIMFTLNGDGKEIGRKVRKLHHQFGHPTCKRLTQLFIDAGITDERCFEYASEISNSCEVCIKYKKTPSRPVVSVNMARNFNEVVAMDLKEFKKGEIYFLHLVDMATRFSRSCIVKSKEPKVIVEKIIEIWLGTGIGAPEKVLCDNGGEWANNTFLELCEQMNIRVMHTAAYSPFSNGLCERNHAVIDEMVAKIMCDQPTCSLSVALAWAVNAKNCLQMVGGYSPYQLVFGRNPRLPCAINDNLPALEGVTSSDVLAKHLNASHSARKAFIAAETSEKIRRALRHNIRGTGITFQSGDLVYFKKENQNEWKGPATVIGQEGKTVILKYGSYIIRVHETRIQETLYEFNQDKENGRKLLIEMLKSQTKEKSETVKKRNSMQERTPGLDILPLPMEDDVIQDDYAEAEENSPGNELNGAVVEAGIPKIGQKVKFLLNETGEWHTATVHSRAGKATGKYCDWRNIEYEDGRIASIDWKNQVQSWSTEDGNEDSTVQGSVHQDTVTEKEFGDVLVVCGEGEDIECREAKAKELSNWRDFGVYREVPNAGQKALSVRWVMTKKTNIDGDSKIKARLVARGFEESEEIQSDSPTVSKEVLCSFVAILASKNWSVNSIDIKAAFLQGAKFERDVYLKPPKEADCDVNTLWKLEKCVYGLNDAARTWYITMKTFLLSLGCTQVKTDPAAFYWFYKGDLCGIFLMHVDDFLWGGTSKFEDIVIHQVRKTFFVGDQSNNAFKYVGLEVMQNGDGIMINQNKYCKSLDPIHVSAMRASRKGEDCNKPEIDNLRSLVGQLGWLCTSTRPDLSYEVLELSCKLNHPKVEDLLQANKCIRKANTYESTMFFPCLGDISKCKLVVYSDASHANLPDGSSSAGGFVVFLVGENKRCCPLYWESKKIKRVVKSTLAAETLAATDAVDMAFYLGKILSQVLYNVDKNAIPIELYVDNHSLYDNVYSTKNVSEKRLRIDIAILKQMVYEGELKIFWMESRGQLADILTKKGVNSVKLMKVFENGLFEM